jgi:hypothetical protein
MSTFTKDLDPAKRPNAVDQMFIMAVKFYGYDINGLPLDGDNAAVQGYDNGDKTDNNAVLQRYYAFKLADMKYVLNGRAVVYNCSGYLVQEIAAYGELNSSIQQKMQLEGGTVGECLTGEKGLLTLLNKANEKQVDTGKIKKPNILKVEFYDESGELVSDGDIERGTLVDDDSFAKSTAPMAKIKSTKDVTVAESFKQVKVDKNKRAINIDDGTNILTVIENLIIKSSYIGDALAAAKSIEADKNKTIKKTPIKELTWFNVQPSVTIIGRDENTNLWAYEIVYQVRPYKIPYLKTSVGSTVSKYPGPTKFYDYWLTGGNSEVLSYQQEYNSMLFMPQLQSSNKDEMAKTPKDGTPVGTKNAVPLKDNINMGAGRSTEINDLVAAQLYSPADNATAKIKIIGDPDYLMSSMGNPRITANKVFSGDGSIDGRNGQVFIQITFNTSFDYEPNTGLMRIDDRIQFYKTDKVKNLGIDGIVFRLTGVKSSLHKGKFEQELDCIIVSESELVGELADGEESKREGSDEGGSKSDNKPANSAKSSPQMVRSQSHDRLSANAPTEETEVSNVEIRGASGEDLDAFYGGGSGEPDETPEVEPTPQQDEDDDSADSLWDPFTDVAVEEYDDSGREDDPFADVQLAEDDDDNPRLA